MDTAKTKYNIVYKASDQIHLVINSVKITFFQYPYPVTTDIDFEKTFRMPDLLTLAAMKAFALGRRSKWKDYVDLYFLLRDHFSIKEISMKADAIFGQLFSEKLFRAQLAFHKDIDYSETVEYLPGFEIGEKDVQNILIEKSLRDI
jgi:hypothetical protein